MYFFFTSPASRFAVNTRQRVKIPYEKQDQIPIHDPKRYYESFFFFFYNIKITMIKYI